MWSGAIWSCIHLLQRMNRLDNVINSRAKPAGQHHTVSQGDNMIRRLYPPMRLVFTGAGLVT